MSISIYGFGSFFNGSGKFKDVDLLIIHDSNCYESCLEAISLKREILDNIDNTDVTMLSKSEEFQFKFIEKAYAIPLCFCEHGKVKESVNNLKIKLQSMEIN